MASDHRRGVKGSTSMSGTAGGRIGADGGAAAVSAADAASRVANEGRA